MNRNIATRLFCAISLAAIGCASTRGATEEDLSARAHERAAAEDQQNARGAADRYDNRAVRFVELYPDRVPACDRGLPGACSPYWALTKNPTDRELALASAYRTRARQHRQMAEKLRAAEAHACAMVSLADQDFSPFLHQRDLIGVEEIGQSGGRGPLGTPAGAAIAFAMVPALDANILQRIVDCHIARNAALGWEQADNAACPLNVKGASAKVRDAGDKLVVDVTSTDAAAALEIVKRARALLPNPTVSSAAR